MKTCYVKKPFSFINNFCKSCQNEIKSMRTWKYRVQINTFVENDTA